MIQPPASGSGSAQRRARREFIRTHHPDAGGDDQAFVTGLANFDAAQPPVPPVTSEETVSTQQAWPVSLTTAMLRRLRGRYQRFRSR